jgi:hypothetical protein
MKAIVLSVLALAAAYGVLAQAQKTIVGSGHKATRTVAVGKGKSIAPFSKVLLTGAFDLDVKGGGQSDIKITGDDNLLSLVKLSVKGDTLIVETKEGANYSSKIGLKVSFSSSSLNGVSISGSGDAKLTNFKADKAQFAISGSGDIQVVGQANSVDGSISGSGDIDLAKMPARSASASIAGSGTIKLNVTDKLSANISGSGDIRYAGKPKSVSKSVVGSGEIRPL